MRELHIKINKCENCLLRQWFYESDGCREQEGYWCYHPDKDEWVVKNKWGMRNTKMGMYETPLYEGDFPTDCPLTEIEGN